MADEVEPGKTLDVRAGYKTTEFWLAVATFVAGLLLAIFGKTEIQQGAGAALLSLTSTGYAVSRGMAKKSAAVMLVGLLLIGCGSINEQYVEADRATYEAIAPEYVAYVKSGILIYEDGSIAVVSSADQDLSLRSVRLWEARILEAEASIKRKKEEE